MREWLKLRESMLDQKSKFEDVRVWGQPAAWSDSIIQCWLSELVHEKCPQTVNIVDCFCGQWSPVVMESLFWNSQMQVPVGPDCTPLLQVADVAVIAQAKVAGNKRKSELGLLLNEAARREGVEFSGRFGKFEIFSVVETMAKRQSQLQQERDVVLSVMIQTQCLAVRPDASGRLVKVADTPLGQKFPSLPFCKGLSSGWVKNRFSGFDSASGTSCCPDWELLGGSLEVQCVSDEPQPGEVVVECISTVVSEGLTAEEKFDLEGPVRKWRVMCLPPQLASQRPRSRKARTTKWGERLSQAFLQGRSLKWVAKIRAVTKGELPGQSGLPVPRIATKKKKSGAFDSDRNDGPGQRLCFKRRKIRKRSQTSKSESAPVPPVLEDGVRTSSPDRVLKRKPEGDGEVDKVAEKSAKVPIRSGLSLPNHELLKQRVIVTSESSAADIIGKEWTVVLATTVHGSGGLCDGVQLRLQGDKLNTRYAMQSEVQLVSELKKYESPGSDRIDYRQFNTVKRREVAKGLAKDILIVKVGEMLANSTMQWGLAELQYRLPVDPMEVTVFTCDEVHGVCNATAVTEADQCGLAEVISRCQKNVVAVIHSDTPRHYTVLERVVDSGKEVKYFYRDSLRNPSASGQAKAQQFMDKLQWNGTVPPPSNLRHQAGGWECGLFSLQFVEEFFRSLRGELVLKGPVKVASIGARVNDYIEKVKLSLPVTIPVKSPPPPVATQAEVQELVKAAVEKAVPVESAPILSEPVAGLGESTIPQSAVEPVYQAELTLAQAVAARSTCSKCHFEGCSHCMGKWFVDKKYYQSKKPKAKSKAKGKLPAEYQSKLEETIE